MVLAAAELTVDDEHGDAFLSHPSSRCTRLPPARHESVVVTTDEIYGSGALTDLETRLIDRFSPPLRPEQVQRCLNDAIARFATARIQAYRLVLTERAATDRLRLAVAQQPSRDNNAPSRLDPQPPREPVRLGARAPRPPGCELP
jgi:hypothetical protein